jgi:SAM-dependent methyltransferase
MASAERAGAPAAAPPGPGIAPTSDPTRRFTQRAQDYARARPGYPQAVADELVRALALAPGAHVVDLGCGTGLSCLPFLRAGLRVTGLEPNETMRGHAQALAADWPGLAVAAGRAESTGLADGCADLLVAAQAFHWFDVPAARAESLRVLRRPAWAALIWNDRRDAGSPFAEGYEALLRRYSRDYLEIRHRHGRVDRLASFFGHGDWSTIALAHADRLDEPLLAARLNSASYMPGPDQPEHAAMLRALRELFEATSRDGTVCMEFDTRVLYGAIAPAD